jgi:hypothetical protein
MLANGGSLDKMSIWSLVSTRLASLRPSSATACTAVRTSTRGGVTQWTFTVVAGPTNLKGNILNKYNKYFYIYKWRFKNQTEKARS